MEAPNILSTSVSMSLMSPMFKCREEHLRTAEGPEAEWRPSAFCPCGNKRADNGASHRPSDFSMCVQCHTLKQNANRPSSMLTGRASLFAFLSCQV